MPIETRAENRSGGTVLFVAMRFPSFIREDMEILSERFPVRCFHYIPSKRMVPNAWRQIRLFAWLLRRRELGPHAHGLETITVSKTA